MTFQTKTYVFNPVYTERILKQEHYRVECVLPIDALDLKFEMREYVDDMILRLQYKIYAEEMGYVEEKVHFQVYVSWWDHFKATRAPKWFKNLFPVLTRLETKTVGISMKAMYPQFRPMRDQEVVTVREITRPGIFAK